MTGPVCMPGPLSGISLPWVAYSHSRTDQHSAEGVGGTTLAGVWSWLRALSAVPRESRLVSSVPALIAGCSRLRETAGLAQLPAWYGVTRGCTPPHSVGDMALHCFVSVCVCVCVCVCAGNLSLSLDCCSVTSFYISPGV